MIIANAAAALLPARKKGCNFADGILKTGLKKPRFFWGANWLDFDERFSYGKKRFSGS